MRPFVGRVPTDALWATVTRGKDDRNTPYLCTRKLMTDGPTCSLLSGMGLQIWNPTTSDEKDALVMVEGALELSSVYNAVLIIVEGVKHFSPLL